MQAVWQDLGDPNTLIYLLSYKNRAAREAGWAAFNADPKMDGITNEVFCAADDQGLHDERDRLLAAQVTDPQRPRHLLFGRSDLCAADPKRVIEACRWRHRTRVSDKK